MWKNRVTLPGLLQAAAVATVACSVVTVFDFAHHNIELFSHFRAQYLAASVLLFIVFAVWRSKLYSLLLLGTGILNASFVLPWYFDDFSVEGNTVIKILGANVLSSNDEYDRLIALIGAEQPDLIFLQEFTPAWDEATRVLKSDYPYRYAEPSEGNFGIALYSRIALDSATHVDSPPLANPTIVATLTLNGQALTLINTHATIPVTRSLFDARNEQIDSIADLVANVEGDVILIGDFNLSVWCRRYRMFEQRTGLRNTRRGFGIIPTWPTYMPLAMIPIDHALVSAGIGVVGTRSGKRIGSDHLPIIVELAIGQLSDQVVNPAAAKPAG